jgi:hypothetical protein
MPGKPQFGIDAPALVLGFAIGGPALIALSFAGFLAPAQPLVWTMRYTGAILIAEAVLMNKPTLVLLALIASCTAVSSMAFSEPSISVSTPIVRDVSTSSPNNLGPMYREYQQRLHSKISYALSSLSLSPDEKCTIKIFQLPLGKIFKVEFAQCSFTLEEQEDVRSRLVGVQLPHAGYEPVAGRQLRVTVCARADQCKA